MKLRVKSKGKIALIVVSCIVGVIIIAIIVVYLYIRSMISKINIVDNTGLDVISELQVDDMPNSVKANVDGNLGQVGSSNEGDKTIDLNIEEDEIDDEAVDMPVASEDEINDIESKIQNNIKSTEIKYDKNVFNLLLIGTDSRKSGGSGRSDAMILISINKKKKNITATSILRDIYLKIPGKDKNNRINTAFAYGGAKLLLDTIEQNFKIKVDKYVIVDFYAFIDMVDAVGGVTLKVTDADIPVINGYIKELNRLTGKGEDYECLTQAGTLLLNGKQALGYSRNRYVGTDFARTARQREVLEQVFDKVKGLKISKITDLMNSILPQVTTNMNEGEIMSLLFSLPSFIKYDINQVTIPTKGTYKDMRIRGMAVLGIDFEKNIKKLYESIYDEVKK